MLRGGEARQLALEQCPGHRRRGGVCSGSRRSSGVSGAFRIDAPLCRAEQAPVRAGLQAADQGVEVVGLDLVQNQASGRRRPTPVDISQQDAHQAERVTHRQGRLGRSWGCPALRSAVAQGVIDLIKGGNFVFAWHPDKDWVGTSPYGKCVVAMKDRPAGASRTAR